MILIFNYLCPFYQTNYKKIRYIYFLQKIISILSKTYYIIVYFRLTATFLIWIAPYISSIHKNPRYPFEHSEIKAYLLVPIRGFILLLGLITDLGIPSPNKTRGPSVMTRTYHSTVLKCTEYLQKDLDMFKINSIPYVLHTFIKNFVYFALRSLFDNWCFHFPVWRKYKNMNSDQHFIKKNHPEIGPTDCRKAKTTSQYLSYEHTSWVKQYIKYMQTW